MRNFNLAFSYSAEAKFERPPSKTGGGQASPQAVARLSCARVSARALLVSPRADLLNVFDIFLPQLLLYPNPADPLNGEAAALMMREPERYTERIRGAPPANGRKPRGATPLGIALSRRARRIRRQIRTRGSGEDGRRQ